MHASSNVAMSVSKHKEQRTCCPCDVGHCAAGTQSCACWESQSCIGAFVAAAVLTGYPFRYTPLGGFLAALLPGMLFLPHVKSEKFEWFLPYLALLACVAFLVALPLYVYLWRLARVSC